MTKRFRKKPDTTEVEAVQWTGENREEVEEFALARERICVGLALKSSDAIPSDWIVRDEDSGICLVVSSEDFQATYEPADQGLDGGGLEEAIAEIERNVNRRIDPAAFNAYQHCLGILRGLASTQPVVDLEGLREHAYCVEEFLRKVTQWNGSAEDELAEAIESAEKLAAALDSDSKEKGT